MSHPNPSLLSSYNGLTDKYLTGYFNNTRIRRHLVKVGLITRNGIIVPDKDNKFKAMRECRQRHSREFMIQPLFEELLDIERQHQLEMKKKREDIAKRERVHKIKVERSKRYSDDIIPLCSSRLPLSSSNSDAGLNGPEVELSESSESSSSTWSDLTIEEIQQPIQFPPLYSAPTHRTTHSSSRKPSSGNKEWLGSIGLDRNTVGIVTMNKYSGGTSPYEQPVISHLVTPVPPAKKKKESCFKSVPEGVVKGRKFHLYMGPNISTVKKESKVHEAPVQSNVLIKMIFCQNSVSHSPNNIDLRHEVKVFQQHCEGENICVFKGKLRQGDFFQFISRRSRGFPFGLTFYLNGLQVEQLNSCCEFRHQKASEIKGRDRHFSFVSMVRASPCYKCVLAFGLYKKSIHDLNQSSIQTESSQRQAGVDHIDSEDTDTLSEEKEDKPKDDDEREATESSPSGNEISSSLSTESSYSHKETSVYSDSEAEEDEHFREKGTPSPRSTSFSSYSSSKDSEEEAFWLQDRVSERNSLEGSFSSMDTNTARSTHSEDSEAIPVQQFEKARLKSRRYSQKETSVYSDSEAEEDKAVEQSSNKDSAEDRLRLRDSASERHSLERCFCGMETNTTRSTSSEDSEATGFQRDLEADDKSTDDQKEDSESTPVEHMKSSSPSNESSYYHKEAYVYSDSESKEDQTKEKRTSPNSPRSMSSYSSHKDSEEEGCRLQDSVSERNSLEGSFSGMETNTRSTHSEDSEATPKEPSEDARLERDFEADNKSSDDERDEAESSPMRYRRFSCPSNEGSCTHKETSVNSPCEEDETREKRTQSTSPRKKSSSDSSNKDSEEEGLLQLQDSASESPNLEVSTCDLQTNTGRSAASKDIDATLEEQSEEAELERVKMFSLASGP
ncbi:glutamate-rich protein 3 isoform X1 [Arapaima gigas]